MLQKLYIRDIAIIDELNVEFGSGLNILTGETGAGKSIIIGAVGLLLGDRAKSDLVRQGAHAGMVEGWFQVPVAFFIDLLDESFDFQDGGLILRREISASGKSRCFVNDSPVPLALLTAIGDILVDLHGQHEHQNLLRVERHLTVLDNFSADTLTKSKVKESFKRCRSLEEKLKLLGEQESLYRQQRDLLEFQVQEIVKIAPKDGEEASLEQEERILQNSERIFQTAKQLTGMLYEDENSVSERMSIASNMLSGLIPIDPAFDKWTQESQSVRIAVEEMARAVESYAQKIEFNPQRLEEIRERLALFSRLKKKYGGSIRSVLDYFEETKNKLSRIETLGDEIQRITLMLNEERILFSDLCLQLSQLRRTTALELENKIASALEELGLKNGVFKILIQQRPDAKGIAFLDGQFYASTVNGIDHVEFFVSLNAGEEPKPLSQVASGGEISRIMLALKTVLAEADQIPVLVFDEIDTGISGRIARVVGHNLKEVSRRHQVLCITHLAQIASLGDQHFCVEKVVADNRSRTTVRSLNQEERVAEIAKLIGGETVTESAIQSAKELLVS